MGLINTKIKNCNKTNLSVKGYVTLQWSNNIIQQGYNRSDVQSTADNYVASLMHITEMDEVDNNLMRNVQSVTVGF